MATKKPTVKEKDSSKTKSANPIANRKITKAALHKVDKVLQYEEKAEMPVDYEHEAKPLVNADPIRNFSAKKQVPQTVIVDSQGRDNTPDDEKPNFNMGDSGRTSDTDPAWVREKITKQILSYKAILKARRFVEPWNYALSKVGMTESSAPLKWSQVPLDDLLVVEAALTKAIDGPIHISKPLYFYEPGDRLVNHLTSYPDGSDEYEEWVIIGHKGIHFYSLRKTQYVRYKGGTRENKNTEYWAMNQSHFDAYNFDELHRYIKLELENPAEEIDLHLKMSFDTADVIAPLGADPYAHVNQ